LNNSRPTTHDPRICIIGAGPAGSIAALILSRAGIATTLIEQHRFPRDKVCGECLSALGIDVLRRLRFRGLPNVALLNRAILFDQTGRRTEVRLPRPMWGISRNVLDEYLLNAARAAGTKILQPARCEQIIAGENPQLRIRDLESNELQTIDADFIILADGKAALLPAPPSPTADMGLKAHFANVNAPADAIELFSARGHYGGIAPIENGLWNIAFSVPQPRVRDSRGNLDALFANIIAENIALSDQMRDASRVGEWLVSALPRFEGFSNWPMNVIPVGNAAAAVEPIGGEGMGLAMRSAELAANHLVNAIHRNIPLNIKSLQSAYRRLWRVRRFACRAAAMAVSSPRISRAAFALARTDNSLTTLALRAIGKF
jgi:flavin-dependent dehydrogenase